MNALGVHTYLGGMSLGAQAVFDAPISVENWKPGIEARAQANTGCRACSFDDAIDMGGVDLVYANPPCSRYSNSAVTHFTLSQQQNLDEFDELKEILAVAQDVNSRALWWETGPLYWSAGRNMARSIHKWGEERWGSATTMVVKIDPRWHGVPQRRPRSHHVTVAGHVNPPAHVPDNEWPAFVAAGHTLGPWLESQRKRWRFDGEHTPLTPRRNVWYTPAPTNNSLKWLRLGSTFIQAAPVDMAATDWYSLAVLSGRVAAWVDEERWVSAEDWAMIMTAPPLWARRVAQAQKPGEEAHALTMLSKGVAPDVAAFVAKNIVEPMMNPTDEKPDRKFARWGDNLWQIDMSTLDTPKRRNKRKKP